MHSSGELLHQCTRVQDAPMLDHLAVFEARLIRRPALMVQPDGTIPMNSAGSGPFSRLT